MIARTSSSGSPLRCRTRRTCSSSGQSTTSTRATRARSPPRSSSSGTTSDAVGRRASARSLPRCAPRSADAASPRAAARRRVGERAAAQQRPVELAVGADELRAERSDDGPVAGLAAPADRVRDVVGIDDVDAAGARTPSATFDLPLPMPPVRPTTQRPVTGR